MNKDSTTIFKSPSLMDRIIVAIKYALRVETEPRFIIWAQGWLANADRSREPIRELLRALAPAPKHTLADSRHIVAWYVLTAVDLAIECHWMDEDQYELVGYEGARREAIRCAAEAICIVVCQENDESKLS